MKEILSRFLSNMGNSMKNNQEGYSSKKVISYVIAICIILINCKVLKSGHWDLVIPMLMADFGFLSVLLGINVADKKLNPETEKTEK